MAVRSLRKITPVIWIPPRYTANYKATVERSDGTVDDITDLLLHMRVEDGATSTIGNFEFEIPNPTEAYSGVWTGMEIFRYYCDYASGTPTTLRFRGRVEKPSARNNNILVTGRSEALFVQEQDIHESYSFKDLGYIIKHMFDTYGGGRYDTSGINVNTGVILTRDFLDIPFCDALEDVCAAAGYECYVSCNLVVEFFESGSRTNTTEGIVHDYNLLEVSDFAQDSQFIKNEIIVIGGMINGVQVRYTASNAASKTAHGVRSKKIVDEGITSFTAAKELATSMLADLMNPPVIGEVKGFMLATIQPGEKIRLSAPFDGLSPTTYPIISYKHEIGNSGLTTTVKINKEARTLSHILKDRIQVEDKKTSASGHRDDLDFSEIELFDSNVGYHSDTEITSGVLKLQTGKSTGTWISQVFAVTNTSTLTAVRVDLVGDDLPGATIEVSNDNGNNYTTVNRGAVLNMDIGTSILVKLTLSTNTQIDSMTVQYSTA